MTPEEQITRLASTLHQVCHDYWETLSAEVAKGTTFHGPDAHRAEAERILGEQDRAQFDHLVNGVDNCSATLRELRAVGGNEAEGDR